MDITPQQLDAFWAGAWLALKVLGPVALWSVAASILNRSIS